MSIVRPTPAKRRTNVEGTKASEAHKRQNICEVLVPAQPELHSDPVAGLRAERILP